MKAKCNPKRSVGQDTFLNWAGLKKKRFYRFDCVFDAQKHDCNKKRNFGCPEETSPYLRKILYLNPLTHKSTYRKFEKLQVSSMNRWKNLRAEGPSESTSCQFPVLLRISSDGSDSSKFPHLPSSSSSLFALAKRVVVAPRFSVEPHCLSHTLVTKAAIERDQSVREAMPQHATKKAKDNNRKAGCTATSRTRSTRWHSICSLNAAKSRCGRKAPSETPKWKAPNWISIDLAQVM